MQPIAGIVRYWNTVRHLRLRQVVGRARFRLACPRPELAPPPSLRRVVGRWIAPPGRPRSWLSADLALFLGVERSLASCGWDDPQVPKLWRYNHHYFEDLLAADSALRRPEQSSIVGRWIRDNPPGGGTGWEPYPTSLRIVNWIKWSLGGAELGPEQVHSLAVQARWLSRRLEWHLLGNHLFANAKALVFAGCFFEGREADAWLEAGTDILRAEIPEQILPDGGQFERSPMYHCLALEDMLDLENLMTAYGIESPDMVCEVRDRIAPMRHWLGVMTHPDGEISFFNDAATGVAPAPGDLDSYARRLGHPVLPPPRDGIVHLPASGYVRLQLGRAVVIADVGPIGPDYLPGHAHADTLAFELSLDGERLLVNSGTSEYGVGPERLRQRGTAAHNTISIDGQDSSEVWGGFRVARRARPQGLVVRCEDSELTVECAHDGYRRLAGHPVHHRRWVLTAGGLEIEDDISPAEGRGRLHLHWAPRVRCDASGSVTRDRKPVARLFLQGASATTHGSTWHPGFGRVVSNESLVARIAGTACATRLTWT